MPDVMVFQEVTPAALAIFLAQPWIRDALPASRGHRGRGRQLRLLMLSSIPVDRVSYTRLPTHLARGF